MDFMDESATERISETVRSNLPLWKRQRKRILDHLIQVSFHDYLDFELPTNIVRAHQRKSIAEVPADQQEVVLFEHFLIVCHRGANTPFIQCLQREDEKITWVWGDEQFRLANPNICRWMESCFEFGTTLFDLQLILSRLQKDLSRGPTVNTFCSLVSRYLRKHVFGELEALETLEGKNLLTLQRRCGDMNDQLLRPLRRLGRRIEQDDILGGELINFLFNQKATDECYHIVGLLDDIISLAIERYYQVIMEWITQCALTFDLAHEFFIWDLRKQQVVGPKEFERVTDLDWTDFENHFVYIPQLVPEAFQSVAQQIYELGKYLYTMQQHNASLDLLSAQYLFDPNAFKNRSLGEFCAQIESLYQECSRNCLEHFRRHYDIVAFARQLPRFFVGHNSGWHYDFVVGFEQQGLFGMELDKLPARMNALLRQTFQQTEMRECLFHRYFEVTVSRFLTDEQQDQENKPKTAPQKGTYPVIELNITRGDPSLKLAFPAKVLEPYRKIFYQLFLLNRVKHLIHSKYFIRAHINADWARQECATVFLFIRFIEVYTEYICDIAANAYAEFGRQLDAAQSLDDLVNAQLDFVNLVMDGAKLDQDNLPLKELVVELSNEFANYACNSTHFFELNRRAAPIVGKIKKFLLENRRSLNSLKTILFGSHFSAIGADANDVPLWELLRHVDDLPVQ